MNEDLTCKKVLDHGFVKLHNIASIVRRPLEQFDASDIDPSLVARMSMDDFAGQRKHEKDMKLVQYLFDHKHNTPIEFTSIWFEMKLPIFVARQIMRSRQPSFNEVSGRYVQLPKEFYIPEPEHVGVKPDSIKQGRDITQRLDLSVVGHFIIDLKDACETNYSHYLHYLNAGVAPEIARSFLHVNHYTHFVMKTDLHNLFLFLKKRLASDAQFETTEYAKVMVKLLENVIPDSIAILKNEIEIDKIKDELFSDFIGK